MNTNNTSVFLVLLLLLLGEQQVLGCKGIGSFAKTAGRTADDFVSPVGQVAEAGLKAGGGRFFGRANKFLRSLAAESKEMRDLPTDVMPLLDDLPDIEMDKVLRDITGEAVIRVQREGGKIATPEFWAKIIPHLKYLKTMKIMDELGEVSIRGIREFEPEQLIELQRLTDDFLEKLTTTVDDVLDETVEEAIDIYARKTAGEVFMAAGEKSVEMIVKFYKGGKRWIVEEMKKPGKDVPSDPADIRFVKEAEDDVAIAVNDLKKAVDEGAPLSILAKKFGDQLEKTQTLKEVLDDVEMEILEKGILAEAKRNAAKVKPLYPSLDEVVEMHVESVVKNIEPVQVIKNIEPVVTNIEPVAQSSIRTSVNKMLSAAKNSRKNFRLFAKDVLAGKGLSEAMNHLTSVEKAALTASGLLVGGTVSSGLATVIIQELRAVRKTEKLEKDPEMATVDEDLQQVHDKLMRDFYGKNWRENEKEKEKENLRENEKEKEKEEDADFIDTTTTITITTRKPKLPKLMFRTTTTQQPKFEDDIEEIYRKSIEEENAERVERVMTWYETKGSTEFV
jgi:hypothetical protein